MGSGFGYEYKYAFSIVDEEEINSEYNKSKRRDGVKTFVFEIRTNFVVVDDVVVVMDRERYDARVCEYTNGYILFMMAAVAELDFRGRAYPSLRQCMAGYKLYEYWMTEHEIRKLFDEAFDFSKQNAARVFGEPNSIVPVVVDLQVRMVQREGESFAACMERAITAHKLPPLCLWPKLQTVDRRQFSGAVTIMRDQLPRIRVEDEEEGLAIMEVCTLCSKPPKLG